MEGKDSTTCKRVEEVPGILCVWSGHVVRTPAGSPASPKTAPRHEEAVCFPPPADSPCGAAGVCEGGGRRGRYERKSDQWVL